MSAGGPAPARPDAVVLFLAHQWSEAIGQRFARLRRELSPFVDCFVLLQDDQGEVLRSWSAFVQAIGAPDALAPFLADELPRELGLRYFGENRIMGNTHFPLLRFARSRRYRHYWQVESDVEYRGNWLSFFGAFRECETPLLASHIHRYHDWPTWPWWHSFAVPTQVELALSDLYKAFFPLFRITPPAIEAVEQVHRGGWLGHFEVVVPTAVTRAGLGLQDLCTINPCYIGASQNPCSILPIQSTLRWRPEVSAGEFWHRGSGALIFHPVKDNWTFDGEKIVRM